MVLRCPVVVAFVTSEHVGLWSLRVPYAAPGSVKTLSLSKGCDLDAATIYRRVRKPGPEVRERAEGQHRQGIHERGKRRPSLLCGTADRKCSTSSSRLSPKLGITPENVAVASKSVRLKGSMNSGTNGPAK